MFGMATITLGIGPHSSFSWQCKESGIGVLLLGLKLPPVNCGETFESVRSDSNVDVGNTALNKKKEIAKHQK